MPHFFLSSARRKAATQHVYIAVPTYGDLKAAFVDSLNKVQHDLIANDISFDIAILAGNCHVDDGRNDLCRMFLESEATHLMFVDADVQFSAASVRKLLGHDKQIIGGVYPFKNDDLNFPVIAEDDAFTFGEDGLVRVKGLPGGFMCIRREIIHKLYEQESVKGAWPNKGDYGTLPVVEIFHRSMEVGRSRRSGDYEFCAKATAAGYEIWLDPALRFGHVGDKIWAGCFQEFYLERNGVYRKNAVELIRGAGPERHLGREAMQIVAKGFGNAPFAADWHLLGTLQRLCGEFKRPKVLECGSGVSTAVMQAVGAKVTALEQSPAWAEQTRAFLDDCGLKSDAVKVAPVRFRDQGGWYSGVPDRPFDIVFIDGPVRRVGGERIKVCDYMPEALKAAKYVVVDDTDDTDGRKTLERLNLEFGFEFETLEGPRREYAVGSRDAT